MPAKRISILLTALALVHGLCHTSILAQATTSTLKGRVIDTDGVGLPGVVVVTSSRTQPTGNKEIVTDIEGNYRIVLLPPASDYLIRVNYPGFAKIEYGPIDLDAGKTTVANLTLRSEAETTETIAISTQGTTDDTE